MKLEFSQQFSKNAQMPNFMKIRPVVAGLFHTGGRADEQIDTTKLTVAVSNLSSGPNTAYS